MMDPLVRPGLTFAAVALALAAATADVSLNGHKLTNIGTPTSGTDAATKDYVDSAGVAEVPTSRTLTAGAGLQGGGDLSANRSFNINPNLTLTSVALATTPAAAGDIRVSKTFALSARRADNAADVSLFLLDGADGLTIGSSSLASQASNVKAGGFHAFQVNGAEVARFDSTQLLLTISQINFAAGQTVAFAQAQHATAAGNPWSLYGQRGAAGFVGGMLTIGGGPGGTSGTNKAGDTRIDGGATVGGVSAKCSFLADGSSALDVFVPGATKVQIQNPQAGGYLLLAGARFQLQDLANNLVLNWGISTTTEVQFGKNISFVGSVAGPSIFQVQNSSAVGNALLLRAQQGFGGFIGGKLQIGGGDGGTAGTNLAGDTQVLLGTLASNTSAKFSLCTGSAAAPTSILDIWQNASGSIALNSPNTTSFLVGGTSQFQIGATSCRMQPGGNPIIEGAVLATKNVLALCRLNGITTTQMPANTGDGVIYVANAATNPTASSVGGGILYCSAGALRYRGTSGTDVQIASA